MAEFNRSAN